MCIVFWALDHPDYGLILCSNRDEYLNRPTRNARFHSFAHEAPNIPASILSGIDEVGGGTWFGITRTGKVAILTNITEPTTNLTSSRGTLVSSFLLSNDNDTVTLPLEERVQKLYPRDSKYAGFNLLLLAPASAPSASPSQLRYDASFVTNSGAGGSIIVRPLSPEERNCGGFSNGIDGKGGNEWPKVKHGMHAFSSVLQSLSSEKLTESELTDRLFELLAWQSPEVVKERYDLRKTVHVAPIHIGESEHMFYGTRLSSVLLVRRDGQVTFIERDVWKEVDGTVKRMDPSSERQYRFILEVAYLDHN